MGRACSQNGGKLECFQNVTGKSTGKRPSGRPRRRWEDLEEIGVNMGNWVDSAQNRDYWRALVNATLNLRVPKAMELNYVQKKILPELSRMIKSQVEPSY